MALRGLDEESEAASEAEDLRSYLSLQAPLWRDCQAIRAAARSLSDFDYWRCDEYLPGGDIRPGSFVSAEPSEKELARRKKIAHEMQ